MTGLARSAPNRVAGPPEAPPPPRPAPPHRRPGFVLASGALCDDATTLTREDGGGGGGRGRGPERLSPAAKTPKSPPPPRGEAARPRATARRAGGADELRPRPPAGAPGLSLPRPEPSARARCAGAYGAGEAGQAMAARGPRAPRLEWPWNRLLRRVVFLWDLVGLVVSCPACC